MTPEQFEERLDQVVAAIEREAGEEMDGYAAAAEFERTVLRHLGDACASDGTAKPTFHERAFPDIVVNGFGVEVKYTTRASWHGTGNSIFEGMRDEDASRIYLLYFRADLGEARWRRYEDCIKGVRISHSPRYMIDMDGASEFFGELGLSYEQFRDLELADKMAHVKGSVAKRLGAGERLWWFGPELDHTLPVNIRLYRNLDDAAKTEMRAEAALMFPEIFKGARQAAKYDGIGVYLLNQHGVLATNLRDMFSAGSVAGPERGGDYLLRSVRRNMAAIRAAAARLDDALFVEYWGESCPPAKRVERWFELIDRARPADPPSKRLGKGRG